MKLLIDIGNTRLKWANYESGKIGNSGAIFHGQECINTELLNAWEGISVPDAMIIACVSSQTIKQQLISAAKARWPGIFIQEVYTEKEARGVSNAYSDHMKLGVDRWLAMLAAYHQYAAAVCIVDCGTAITLDVVNAQGQHLGGMIMPGINLMKQALYQGTADLNICSATHGLGLANNTEAAIFNGNLNSVKGFIEYGLAEFKGPVQLILTGGDADYLLETLKLEGVVENELVLKGLALSILEQEK